MAFSATSGITVPRPEPDETELYDREQRRDAQDPRGRRRASAPLVPRQDRYTLGELIGKGGMGEVVSARDEQIGRDVAIKRLYAAEPNAATVARFLREARIQGRLEHPAIPPVHELAHDEDGRPFFTMRKLDGVTLSETLRDPKSSFTSQRLLRAFVEICHAIDLAHSKRVVHRDLKPSNIVLGSRGEVYVIDWGIARELDSPDAFAGIVLGTPGYMAPEQIRAQRDLDERVDIYALGCILFEIVARRPLHPRGDAGIDSALRGAFPPDDARLPFELVEACRRATALDRKERFASVRELGDIVQAFLDGDRDLAQRRSLANHHLSSARAAFLEVGDDEARRSIVMREAAKALALDPTLSGAAELIGRVMLEAPTTKPAAVERELEAIDLKASRLMVGLSARMTTIYLFMFLIFIVTGVRDVPYLVAYGSIAALLHILCVLGKRGPGPITGNLFLIALVAMIGLLARMFTPVLIAPAVAAVAVGATVFNPTLKRHHVIGLTVGVIVAIGGVWMAEIVGLLSRTMWRDGATLHLRLPVEGIENYPLFAGLAFAALAVTLVSAISSWAAMREIRHAREKLVMQAWHLRQLV